MQPSSSARSNRVRGFSAPRYWRRSALAGFLLCHCLPLHAMNWNVLVGSGGLVFTPATLTIAVNDTVTFRNAGGNHNAVANDGSFRCANGCDGKGGSGAPSNALWRASVTFTSPGTIGYFCETHGTATTGMRGTIIVTTMPVQLQSFDVE